jgi:hypothetical protein
MYVRLGFAVAVHVDPDILLIDEVLSVGDEEFSQKCVAKIQEMKYRGATIVFVTHQLDLVRTLCDRALWLDQGQLSAIGDPMRVIDAYLQSVSGHVRVEEPELAPPLRDENDLLEEERWGSGELLLDRVSLVDDRGRELVALGARTPVSIEMHIRVREPQRDFVFGIGIFHADGTLVYGTNTDIEGLVPERLDTDGTVRFTIPTLDLIAGNYRIDTAVHTKNGRAFDYRRGVIRFVVGSRIHDTGIYRPPHEWHFDGGISIRSAPDLHRNAPASVVETMKEIEGDPDPPRYKKRRK